MSTVLLSAGRQSIVWEVRVRRELLEEAIAQLRDLPYSVWRDVIDRPMAKRVVGRDGTVYRVRTTAALAGGDNIRVTVSLETGGWRRRPVLSESFVITPANQVIE